MFNFFSLRLLLLTASLLMVSAANAESNARQLFGDLKKLVYQIRVIDIGSGDKYSIGSGFQVSGEGHIATNFHVVSSFVHEPEKYRLEFVRNDGSVGPATLLAIDVVHDLAVLRADTEQSRFFDLKDSGLDKGDRVYSMGNPHDLGMTIVEGTYNGLVQTSRYQKILFSGSLNPGMSGGPAMDESGAIVGVNVSTGGEQISFLVPVENLSVLLQRAMSLPANEVPVGDALTASITKALLDDQEIFYRGILGQPFELQSLGELRIPSELSTSLKCWGHTVDKEDVQYQGVHRHCKSEDQIFIAGDFYTGDFFYDFEWMSTESLNRLQFYTVLEERFKHRNINSADDEERITNYRCNTSFVEIDNHTWKASSCFRAYTQYTGLYDALLLMSSVDMNDRAMVVKAGASGISRDNAMALFQGMMESMTWTL